MCFLCVSGHSEYFLFFLKPVKRLGKVEVQPDPPLLGIFPKFHLFFLKASLTVTFLSTTSGQYRSLCPSSLLPSFQNVGKKSNYNFSVLGLDRDLGFSQTWRRFKQIQLQIPTSSPKLSICVRPELKSMKKHTVQQQIPNFSA